MDARRIASLVVALVSLCFVGAGARSANFVVQAHTPEFAQAVAREAERFRRELAIEWLGKELPRWPEPCPIFVQAAKDLGAGGATSFTFLHGEVMGWKMTIQGSEERILDAVLPHEVNHTIFATHFRQPLPRWADEGACTLVEVASERAKQQDMLVHFLKNGRGIAFAQMFAMRQYPRDIMPLYSQGYSLTRFLVHQGGKPRFIAFVGEGLQTDDWAAAIQRHYQFPHLGQLQDSWLAWVKEGSPLDPNGGVLMASAAASSASPEPQILVQDAPAPPTPGAPAEYAAVSQSRAPGPSPFAAANALAGGPGGAAREVPSRREAQGWVAVGGKYRLNRAAPDAGDAASAAEQALDGGVPGGVAPAPQAGGEVTRLPAAQGVQQTILEWSKHQPQPPAGGQASEPPASEKSAGNMTFPWSRRDEAPSTTIRR